MNIMCSWIEIFREALSRIQNNSERGYHSTTFYSPSFGAISVLWNLAVALLTILIYYTTL